MTLNMNVKLRLLPRYYLEFEKQYDRCLLLFKGIEGSLDHWVLGDSFLKNFYLVFDADNYKIGITTNQLNYGDKHEDLVEIDKPR